MMFGRDPYIAHLLDEIAWLRTQAQAAQQRYEVAVAELVRLKTDGQANVAPRPLMVEREQDVGAEVQRMFADQEFAQAGT